MKASLPRPLRVLLALLLVPVVLFANPHHAAAATSGFMSFQLGPTGLERFAADCRLGWTLNSGGMVVSSSSRCDGGPDLSPGYCQPFEGDCGSYGLVLKSTSGATCGSTSFDPFSVSGNATVSTAAGLGGGHVALDPASCVPVEACLSYFFDPMIGGTTDVVDCTPVDLDLDTGPAASECPAGTPHAYWTITQRPHASLAGYVYDQLVVKLSVSGNTLGTARQWGFRYIDPGRNYESGVVEETSTTLLTERLRGPSDPVLDPGPQASIQLYAYIPEPAGTDNYWNAAPVDPKVRLSPTTFPMTSSSNYFGVTDSAQCRWYYGPKRIDDPTSDKDEPFGPSNDPTPPEPITYDPEPVVDAPPIADPGEDFNWLQAIWSLLKSILTTLGNLASAIAQAIISALQGLVDLVLDGLTDLFVPDEGFMDDSFSDITTEWEDTSLTKWMDAAGGITAGSASGCGGLPLNVTLPGDVQVSENVGAACSGSMATAAGIVRMVLSAGLVVTGAFACIRGIGAGFGWAPSVGRGES